MQPATFQAMVNAIKTTSLSNVQALQKIASKYNLTLDQVKAVKKNLLLCCKAILKTENIAVDCTKAFGSCPLRAG